MKRLRRIRDDAEQLIRDKTAWNASRTGDAPFDCEVERVMVQMCTKGLEAAERGEWEKVNAAISEVAAYAERVRREEPA